MKDPRIIEISKMCDNYMISNGRAILLFGLISVLSSMIFVSDLLSTFLLVFSCCYFGFIIGQNHAINEILDFFDGMINSCK